MVTYPDQDCSEGLYGIELWNYQSTNDGETTNKRANP